MISTTEPAPPITVAQLEHFERSHGLSLPEDYRQFLLKCNGGRPNRDRIPVPDCEGNPRPRIHFFFGIGDPVESCDLHWNIVQYADRFPRDFLPIATTEGADKFCLALGGQYAGKVVFVDAYHSGQLRFYPVASGFGSFLESLSRDEDSSQPE